MFVARASLFPSAEVGHLDVSHSQMLTGALRERGNFGVTHVHSAAIGAIVRCLVKLKSAGGGLRIAAAEPMINYSLKLTKVDKVVEIFPTVDQAAEGFSGPEPRVGQRPPGPEP